MIKDITEQPKDEKLILEKEKQLSIVYILCTVAIISVIWLIFAIVKLHH